MGFIGDPAGHLNASENSTEFDKGPSTRITPSACTDERVFNNVSSGRIEPHHVCA